MKRWSNHYKRFVVVAILSLTLLRGTAPGTLAGNHRLRGPGLHQRLEWPINVVWSKAPLRDALGDVAQSHGVAVWLDRRVDPGRRISLVDNDVPIKDVLARVARDEGLGMCLFRSVVYLGPPAAVARLRTLGQLRRESARELPPTAVKRFFRAESMQWEDLATPRELLTGLGKKNGLEIVNPDRVVHDLWPAMDLPALTLVDRLTLILAPLDLTFQIEEGGARVRLVPIPDRVVLTRRYPAGPHPERTAQRWSKIVPESRVRVEGDRIVVEGRLEDHELLAKPGRPATGQAAHGNQHAGVNLDQQRVERVTIKDQPLEGLVRQLAARWKLQLHFDTEALRRSGIDLDQRISLELKDISVDELFQAVLEPAGLTCRRRGSTLEIRAAGP